MVLLNHIKATYPEISDHDFNMIIRSTSLKEIPKKTILWKEGCLVKEADFVIKGCFRFFQSNKEGEEQNTLFAIEDYWIGDINSLLYDQPTLQSIQALEDSKVLSFEKNEFKNLMENCEGFRKFTLQKRARAYEETVKRLVSINESAEVRYENLVKKFPELENRIPLYHVASYLGITPESLSRLRKTMSSKKSLH